jgi:DnaJ-domain-containing protein 1
MTDFFALLKQPRNPWLRTEAVREAFVSAATDSHPDRVHDAPAEVRREAQERYTRLNEAQRCLTVSRTRLRHLLELERGERIKDLQEIPEDLMRLFQVLGTQLKAADAHLRDSAKADSPLLKVALFEQGETVREGLQETQQMLQDRGTALEEKLRSLGERWKQAPTASAHERDALLAQLETLYRLISFHDRWQAQVHSRLITLMEQQL